MKKNSKRSIKGRVSDTGRVKNLIHPVAEKILYSADFGEICENELLWMTQIDLAHVLMLQDQGILDPKVATSLIRAISYLQKDDFASLRGLPSPRGTFMLYEGYLIDTLGMDIGGRLQSARSRNDLNATIQRMRHRKELAKLSNTLLELEDTLLRQAQTYLEVPFPIFTHYQAAQITTLGHYFLAITSALQRSHDGIMTQFRHLGICPLGAGAIAGTSFPINTDTTAALLGFDRGPDNAIDVIASRDQILRTLNECGTLGVTISRLAHDLQLWTTQEFQLLNVEDNLVGISSMMPQKRNVYITENIKGKLATSQGAMQSAAIAMHSTPFSNSICVGTEAVKHLWPALNDTNDAVTLITLLVSGVRQNVQSSSKKIASGFCAATFLADELVRQCNIPFRDAHRIVGTMINEMPHNDQTSLEAGLKTMPPDLMSTLEHLKLSAPEVLKRQKFGGGPAPDLLYALLQQAKAELSRMRKSLSTQQRKWSSAAAKLAADAQAQLN